MSKGYVILIGLVVLAMAAAVRAADESPTTQPTTDAQDVKLTLPWKRLDSLSKDQRKLIQEIHQKALDDIQQIKKRERDEILGVLNDEQEMELQKIIEERNARRRAKETQDSKPQKDGADDANDDDADETDDAASAADTQPS